MNKDKPKEIFNENEIIFLVNNVQAELDTIPETTQTIILRGQITEILHKLQSLCNEHCAGYLFQDNISSE